MPLTTIQASGTKVIGNSTLITQTIHPAVFNYIQKQTSNGYLPSNSEVNLLNNLVWGFVVNGIWDLCDVIYPCTGNSTTTAKWNLKNVDTFPITFNGSWTFASTGMRPTTASTSNYAQTGYIPLTHSLLNDSHAAIYGRTNIGTAQVPIGCTDSTNSRFFQINMSTTANGGNGIINSNTTGVPFVTGITDTRGDWFAQRSSSVLTSIFINGVLNATSANASTIRPNLEVYLGARNNSTVGRDFPSAQEMAFVSMGRSMTANQVRIRRGLIQAFQTGLSRNV